MKKMFLFDKSLVLAVVYRESVNVAAFVSVDSSMKGVKWRGNTCKINGLKLQVLSVLVRMLFCQDLRCTASLASVISVSLKLESAMSLKALIASCDCCCALSCV